MSPAQTTRRLGNNLLPMARNARLTTVAAALALGLALSACGGDSDASGGGTNATRADPAVERATL